MKVKICGITNLGDALAAIDAGADMLGFNFYPPSPRCISIDAATSIIAYLKTLHLNRSVTLVGVFVNESAEQVSHILKAGCLDLAQLSGDETPASLAALGERAFKALRPVDANDLEASITRFPQREAPPAWLIDAHMPGRYGGTGRTVDWYMAQRLARHAAILLAGGLDIDNIAAAVATVRPWGVDVASGVESAPGRKDPRRMQAFIKAARMAEKNIFESQE